MWPKSPLIHLGASQVPCSSPKFPAFTISSVLRPSAHLPILLRNTVWVQSGFELWKKLLETIYIRVQMYLVFAAHRGLSHPALQRLLDVEALKSWVTSHNSYAFRCYALDLIVRACSLFSLDPPLAAGANLINLIESILFAIILYLYPGDQEALCHVVQSRLASKFSSFGYSF